MTKTDLITVIDAAFDARDTINTETTGEVRDAVNTALGMLDAGEARVANVQTRAAGGAAS